MRRVRRFWRDWGDVMHLTVDSGQLPVGWEIKKLGEVCQIKPPKEEAKQRLSDTDIVSFVPMSDLGIQTKTFSLNENKPLSEVVGSYTYFAENDVLLAKITPCFENGKLGIARNLTNGVGFGSSEYIVFRSKGQIEVEYLFYFLSQNSFRKSGASVMTGAVGHKRVPKDFIENYPILLPSLHEQKRIVAILDEAFEGIDKAIANTKKNFVNSRELFESYLNSIFINKGDGWVEKKLGDVCDFLNGFAFKSIDTVNTSDVQLIRMGNLYQNILDLERKSVFYPNEFREIYAKYVLSEGDLIMSLTGTVDKEDYGYTVEVPKTERTLLLNQRIAKFINIDTSYVDKKFFLHLLRSNSFLNALYKSSRGVRQANLSSLSMKKIPINLPPVEIQKLLVSEFRALDAETQRLETIYRQKIAALNELKQSILQKAFTGELTADTPNQVRKTAKEGIAA
jgi:type I restriction enzyme, S subunit